MKSKFIFAFLLMFGFGSVCQAQDWTYWRGPEHDGISRETNLPEFFDMDTKENVLWESPIGGRATPIILNGRVYLNCRTPDDINDPKEKVHAREKVVCWDLKTGKVLWQDFFNVFQTDIPAPRVGWASMAGDKETGYVYMHSVSGLFRCYDSKGNVVWEKSLYEQFGKISGYGGRTQSPIIDENRVIVSYLAANWGETKGPAPKHTYYAFDKKTGDLLWVSAPGGRPKDTNYSTPIIRVIDGQRVLIGGNSDGGVYGINARTGKPVWGFRMSRRGLNAAPVVAGNRVFISHGEDNIDNERFGRIQAINLGGKGDITDSASAWRIDGIKAGYTGLLVKDGVLYVVTDKGKLMAFDAKKGKKLWTYSLGTVGKGSPVWADDKIYVMEVNGNIHILEADRDGCDSLCSVKLKAVKGGGLDEIYASPAIADGKIVFVTRDRTICIGLKEEDPEHGKPVALKREAAAGSKIAAMQLHPCEVALMPGQKQAFTLKAFDANGVEIKAPKLDSLKAEGLGDGQVSGNVFTAGKGANDFGGTVSVTVDGVTAKARIRTFRSLDNMSWDFEEFKGIAVPPSWIRAHVKIKPTKVDGTTAMMAKPGKGRPSHHVLMGPYNMKDYTVQADVFLKKDGARMSDIGITCHRYNLILKSSKNRLTIQSWAPHKRMAVETGFDVQPETWYTMKLMTKVTDGKATVFGKVWKRGEAEPEKWTIEAKDPHANLSGSPGLYTYSQAEAFFDNVKITPNK